MAVHMQSMFALLCVLLARGGAVPVYSAEQAALLSRLDELGRLLSHNDNQMLVDYYDDDDEQPLVIVEDPAADQLYPADREPDQVTELEVIPVDLPYDVEDDEDDDEDELGLAKRDLEQAEYVVVPDRWLHTDALPREDKKPQNALWMNQAVPQADEETTTTTVAPSTTTTSSSRADKRGQPEEVEYVKQD